MLLGGGQGHPGVARAGMREGDLRRCRCHLYALAVQGQGLCAGLGWGLGAAGKVPWAWWRCRECPVASEEGATALACPSLSPHAHPALPTSLAGAPTGPLGLGALQS